VDKTLGISGTSSEETAKESVDQEKIQVTCG